MGILSNVLAPSVVTGIVSRIYTPQSVLQRYFGMQIGGPNVNQISGRAYAWDIFDNVRSLARGRAPATGPASVAPNPVGRQTNTFPRAYEKMALSYELIANIRTLGQNAGTRDRMGATYLDEQARIERIRHDNFREAQLGLLLNNGKFSVRFQGDDWIICPSRSGGVAGYDVDYLVPSGNKSSSIPGLAPISGNIIDASWATASTHIPKHLDQINQAFQNLVGAPLGLVLTDSTVWRYALSNTDVINMGGSANMAYAQYEMEPLTGPDGQKVGMFVGVLKAVPWLKWLILDNGLEIDDGTGTGSAPFTRWYDGTKATFMIDYDPYWMRFQEGSEPVKENPMAPAVERFGFHSWLREWDEPARIEIHTLQNCIPEMRIPKGLMIAKVA